MSGGAVGGSIACGGAPGGEAEPWLVESPMTFISWARATPNPRDKRQRETVSLIFMTPPQGWTTVGSLSFDISDRRVPPSRREEKYQRILPARLLPRRFFYIALPTGNTPEARGLHLGYARETVVKHLQHDHGR